MLKLERVEISGFKSFGDRTEVVFPLGITAIVGPNGCGKSNIGDAINWVLGEQSPRMLRGKEMADVIFAGSEGRKAVGLAEVSLFLGGLRAAGVGDEDTSVITRRLHRDGESEYLLNGSRTRLKDIQELLDKYHVGARTYATIEQGRIEQILNAKPKDRRLLIEDAAGIAGFKNKRRLTELKLEATQANLLRVNDVVVEVERQIRSLRRQAGRARRYRRLRDELRRQETIHFGVRAHRLDAELAETGSKAGAAADAESAASARVGRLEADLAAGREALEVAERGQRQAAEEAHRLDLEIDRCEAEIRASGERIAQAEATEARQGAEATRLAAAIAERDRGAEEQRARAVAGRAELEGLRVALRGRQAAVDAAHEARRALRESVERLRAEQFAAVGSAADARNSLRATEEALERLRAQRARIEADRSDAGADLSRLEREREALAAESATGRRRVAALREACAALETRVAASREAESQMLEALSAAREEQRSAAARLATLEDVATRFAGVSDGVRTLLGAAGAAGLRTHGVVADYIEARPDVEAIAESYLESFLPAVLVEDDADLHRAAELLRSQGAARTALLSRTRPAGALAVGSSPNGRGDIPAELLADPRVRGRLRERLELRAAANGVIQQRLGDAVLVDDLGAALDLHRAYPSTDYVTAEGDVVQASGLVWSGRLRGGDQGLLAHKRRTQEARSRAGEAATRVAEAAARLEAARADLASLERELRERRQELEESSGRLVEVELHAHRAGDERERTGRRTEVLAGEWEMLGGESARLEAARLELAARADAAAGEQRAIEGRLGETGAELERAEAALSGLLDAVSAEREAVAVRQERQEALEQEERQWSAAVAELAARLEIARTEQSAARARAAQVAAGLARAEGARSEHMARRETLAVELAAAERGIAEQRERLGALDAALRAAREELDLQREARRETELARARAEAAREHLDELCRQEIGADAAASAAQARVWEIDLATADVAAVEAEIGTLRERIEALGPVNMTAVEEFAELEQRHGFLVSQRQDLEQSMAALRETIRRINRSTRERFLEAFEAIRGCYQEVFQLLFHGGRADLRLEEGEDVLDCGIEILVQPPGKRLANINLMSGGEKSLSAIALLFAIFRFQPSPFCLLDEVDAALDDVNVGRFTRMLSEYATQTQFIIVTHNKVTMESANLLYGVTMQEPGVSKLVSLKLH